MIQEVILVSPHDEPIGTMEKMEAHEKALLHRAFSVFLFDSQGKMLLQQRADSKYHSPGLWTNACCSHPMPGEATLSAAQRRLQEELGITADIRPAFQFTYRADFDNGLTEHEYDHVFVGRFEGSMQLHPEEVKAVSYEAMDLIRSSIVTHPEQFTAWFKIAFPLMEEWLLKHPL